MGDPFEKSEKLVGMSSRVEAPEDIKKDLLEVETIGKNRLLDFVKSRIETNNMDFYAPIKKNKLRTFDTAVAVKKIKVKGKDIAVRSDRETFARLLIIQKCRGIDMKVLKYELSPVPLSLSNPDTLSTLCKTVKASLFKFLNKSIETVDMVPENTRRIYDDMVLFQKLPPTLVTFGDISDYVLKKIMKDSSRICFFVTNYYLPESVKSLERNARSKIGLLRMESSRRDQPRPKQFDKFLRLSQNKIDLLSFLIKDWSSNTDHCQVLDGKELYITFKDKAFCINAHHNQLSKIDVDGLSSQQEEADTKMFLAAQFAF